MVVGKIWMDYTFGPGKGPVMDGIVWTFIASTIGYFLAFSAQYYLLV